VLAGDAYFHHGEVGGEAYTCPPGLQAYQKLMEADATARLHNQARLRELAREHGREVRIVCSHDPVELDRMAAAAPVGEVRTADVPAAAPTT
jgi:hypothetical protein